MLLITSALWLCLWPLVLLAEATRHRETCPERICTGIIGILILWVFRLWRRLEQQRRAKELLIREMQAAVEQVKQAATL